jgi:hypothetical protein
MFWNQRKLPKPAEDKMRHICCLLLAAFAINISSRAQARNPTPPPQTARQALIEMFLGSDGDALAQHLPENARHTLIRKGETSQTSMVQRISLFVRQNERAVCCRIRNGTI